MSYPKDIGSRPGATLIVCALIVCSWIGLSFVPADPARLKLSFVLEALLGVVLQRARFCFLCIWRDFLDRRDVSGVLAVLAALAVGTAGYTLIYGAWLPVPSPERLPPTAHIGPVGPVLAVAGLCFGAGMAISGSCISAHLYRLGEGSPTAPFALIGTVAGFWIGFSVWNDLYVMSIAEAPVVFLPHLFGYEASLLLALAALAFLAILALRFGRLEPKPAGLRTSPLRSVFVDRWPPILSGAIVGLIAVAAYFRLSPLGVTAGIGARSRALGTTLGIVPVDLFGLDGFRGCVTVLGDALLTPNGVFVGGLVLAAFAMALASGQFAPKRPGKQHILRGLLGGLLLGFGAMIGLGCTIGTLLSGIMAGALSGWVYLVFLVIGVTGTLWIGRALRLID